MKVLLVNKFHYLKGGSETYCFSVAEALASLGHEVAWFAMEDPRNLPCAESDYFVPKRDYSSTASPLSQARDGLALVYSLESRRRFDKLLNAFRPDVIHLNLVHRQITLSILDAPYLKRHRVPVVYTAHDYILVCPNYTLLDGAGSVCEDCLSGRLTPCVRKRCVKGSLPKSVLACLEARFLRAHGSYRKIDRIIAPSHFMGDKLVEGGFPRRQIVYMQNFVSEIAPASAGCVHDHTDGERPYLLYFGRLSREKGVNVLIDAFLSVAHLYPDWRLVIAGDGPEKEALASQAACALSEGGIEFVGHLEGRGLRDVVSRASFAVLSSRWYENMPYSLLEALAEGTPVIGTRVGGIPEVIRDGVTGFLAEPGDVESLRDAIVRGMGLRRVTEAYRAMQARCRAYVLDCCDKAKYMAGLMSLYEELLADGEDWSR